MASVMASASAPVAICLSRHSERPMASQKFFQKRHSSAPKWT
jgi:hypothetical protein